MVKKTVLDSGLVIISEYRPQFPSFALSYSIRSGSRAENRENNGIHHFIEHMMFKGSEKYDLKQIAAISDRLGGGLNAFTGKEITQLYIKTIDGKLRESFDLLTGMVLNSTFPEGEFLKEKGVVLQEIKEAEDDPDTHIFETFYERVFADNGLAFPITGKEDQVSGFSRKGVFDFYKQSYIPANLLLALVGDVQHEELVDLAARAFAGFPRQKPGDFSFKEPGFCCRSFVKRNASLKQLYVVIGFEGISTVSPLKYQFMIMNDILGSGMSSRLFQAVREDRGLAYTINSFSDAYLGCGIQFIYGIIEPRKLDEYLKAVKEEILRLCQEGIMDQELIRAKDHMKSSILLSLESNVPKMRFNVNQEFFLNRELTIEEIAAEIDRVTSADIDRLCRDYLNLAEAAIFVYGDIPEENADRFRFDYY